MGGWFSSELDEELCRALDDQKKVNEELRKEIETLREKKKRNTPNVPRKLIESWVDAQMADSSKNLKWMPDFVERKLKIDIMIMVATMMEHIMETSRVQFVWFQNIDRKFD